MLARKVQVEASKRMDAADGDGNGARHAGQDAPIEQDPAIRHFPDVDQLRGMIILAVAPPEPEVADVTAAATSAVLESNHQRVLAGMLFQPAARLLVERDQERGIH